MTLLLRAGKYVAAKPKSFLGAKTSRAVSSTGLDIISPLIGLNEDQVEFYEVVHDFADKELRPFSAKWDEESIFPVDAIKKSAELGFAGIFVKDDVGGSGLSKSDNVVIVEALATGCVGTISMLCVHNMCAGMIDKFGNEEQRNKLSP